MTRTESPPISVSRRGATGGDAEHTVVWVRGDHDIATRVALVVALARAGQLEHADLLVDLSGVTFMDASTIGAIVGSRNRLLSRSQSVALRAPSPSARRVLELCDLAHLVHPAAVDVIHPLGVAAALGTWVDVPSIRPNARRRGSTVRTTVLPRMRQPARSMLATTDAEASGDRMTTEVDRGDP